MKNEIDTNDYTTLLSCKLGPKRWENQEALNEFISRFPSSTPDPSNIDHLLKSLYLGMALVRNNDQFRLELMEYRHSTMTIETVAWITYEELRINPELTFKRFIKQVAQLRTRKRKVGR